MIEYDYLLKKSDGVNVHSFSPSFDTKIANVSKLKGHNSSGKTTLMDMIALSLYGDDSPDVLKKLQDKLKHLKEATNSEFTFNLTACNGSNYLRITSEKSGFINGNPNWISTIEESNDGVNYKGLIKESFRKKYRLIYDMPDRPMERIQELVSEAERELRADIDNITRIRSPLANIISSVESSRNEELILLLKKQIQRTEEMITQKEEENKADLELLKRIQEYYHASILRNEQEHYSKINSLLVGLDFSDRRKRKEQKKSLSKYEADEKKVKTSIKLMLSKYNEVIKSKDVISKVDLIILEKYEHYWDNRDFEKIFNMSCSEIYDYTKLSTELYDQIISRYSSLGNETLVEKKRMLQNLIGVLEPYIKDKMSVLNTNVSELYEQLKTELGDLSKQIDEYENAMRVSQCVKESREFGKAADRDYEELGERPVIEEDDEEYRDQLEAKLITAKESLDDAEKKAGYYGVSFDNYKKILDECNSDRSFSYALMDVSDLSSALENLSGKTDKQNDAIDSLRRTLKDQRKQLEDAEQKEAHPLYGYSSELKELKAKIEKMIPALSEKDGMLVDLSRGEEVIETDETKVFLDSVWIYLGKKLDTIQHIGKTYKVDKINMNTREVFSGDIRINFRDMGTGESQMAYLTGLLNSDDSRTIIALFDEVDHMDPMVISKIQNHMKEMMDSGKLLIGLMAAPGDKTEVEQYE